MDPADRGHLTEAIWEMVELLNAVGQSYWEFLGEELGGAEQGACGGCDVIVSNCIGTNDKTARTRDTMKPY